MMIADAFNVIEATLWIAMGCGFLIHAACRRKARTALAGMLLLAFGGSDLVELNTGAWWRPWWLLLWKAICVVALTSLTGAYYRERRMAAESVDRTA